MTLGNESMNEMTVEEYRKLCLEVLSSDKWRAKLEWAREDYLSGGWHEEELAQHAALTLLYGCLKDFGNSHGGPYHDVWVHLPVDRSLQIEVLRKTVIERSLATIEALDPGELYPERQAEYQQALQYVRDLALAMSLGILPGTPEFDEWKKEGRRSELRNPRQAHQHRDGARRDQLWYLVCLP